MDPIIEMGCTFAVEMLSDEIEQHQRKIARLKKLSALLLKTVSNYKAQNAKREREWKKQQAKYNKANKHGGPFMPTAIAVQ